MARIGGKLHYGHPDFLNAVYMTTRGGVSKVCTLTKIFMNAVGRGGKIKHAEYYQCGKGHDLGFGTILNFQTKIGTGMGEQMLSREYYYLGSMKTTHDGVSSCAVPFCTYQAHFSSIKHHDIPVLGEFCV